MTKRLLIIFWLLTFGLAGAASADTGQTIRYYTNAKYTSRLGFAILLKGTPRQIDIFFNWLDQIAAVPKGFDTLEKIAESGHQLVIQHVTHALMSAGRTQAPMSANLINGKGESVQILFNAHIPDSGSHMVYDAQRQLIEYTAVQNLYHELAHAMHMMNGTWRYFKSEQQAIEEENRFREDLAKKQGKAPVYRFRKRGALISDVDHTIAMSEWYGPTILRRPAQNAAADTVYSTGVSPRKRGWR